MSVTCDPRRRKACAEFEAGCARAEDHQMVRERVDLENGFVGEVERLPILGWAALLGACRWR